MYNISDKELWPGRVENDLCEDTKQFYQVVEFIDIEKNNLPPLSADQKGCAILGFDVDEGVRRNNGRTGAALGPRVLRKVISSFAVHFDDRILIDAGTVECYNNNLETSQDILTQKVKVVTDAGYFPLLLGGGHEIAYANYRGIEQALPKEKKIGIINFDAHFDLRSYGLGTSSGTGFLQIADYCKEADRNFNYLCLGVQQANNSKQLFNTADSLGAEYIFARHFNINHREVIYDKVNKFLESVDYIYTTICLDVFSSSVAPGVSAVAINGVQSDIIFEVLELILNSGKLISFDIAELNPNFDQDNRTAKLAGAIIYEIVTRF